jgi:hypothetical protein
MRYNHLDMLPEKAFQPIGKRMTLEGGGKGGGSAPAPAPSSQTVTNTTIPDYAKPYVETMLGKTEALTNINQNPYKTYGGQRIAGFSPLQQQAFSNVENMQTAPQLGQATNFAGMSGLGSLGTAGQMAGAGNQYNQMATNPNATQAFMNPYLSASLQPQLTEIGRQYDITGQQEKSQATGQGAFGGNRQALMQAENARNKNTAMNTAIGQGYNNAFNQAQQAQQFGANLGLQGLQGALSGYGQAGAAAGTLGQLGQTQFGQQQGINTAQQQVGAVQQAQAQQNLDQSYQDFLKQQNYPYQQLAFMSDMVRGLPLSQSASTQYTAPPSMVSQLGGLGMAGLGIYGAAGGFKKEGGIISAYKDGGKVGYSVGGDISTMTDQQLTELLSNPQLNPMEMKAVEDLLALHRRMEINPQTSQIMAQNQGIDAIPTGDMVPETMAGGGIIAFKTGKTVKASNAEDMDTEIADLKNIIKTQNAEMWSSSPTAKSDALQAQYAKQALADKEAEPWNFVRDLGFGAAAGTSQYALSNIGAGGTYANTEAGKRGAAADANDKLALMQQIESEKSQEARKASMLNANQSSLTQLYNNRNTRDSIQATREATAQQRLDTLDSKERNAAASNFKTVYDYAYGLLTKANNNPLETPPDNKLTDDQIDKIATKRALAALPAAHKQYYSQYAPAPTSTASTPYEQYKTRFKEYSGNPARQKQLTEFFRSKGVII